MNEILRETAEYYAKVNTALRPDEEAEALKKAEEAVVAYYKSQHRTYSADDWRDAEADDDEGWIRVSHKKAAPAASASNAKLKSKKKQEKARASLPFSKPPQPSEDAEKAATRAARLKSDRPNGRGGGEEQYCIKKTSHGTSEECRMTSGVLYGESCSTVH